MNDDTGVAYWLWEQEQDVERGISRLSDDIADLERQITEARTRRERLRLTAVEMRLARGIIERSGLKVERINGEVHASIDPPLTVSVDLEGTPTLVGWETRDAR